VKLKSVGQCQNAKANVTVSIQYYRIYCKEKCIEYKLEEDWLQCSGKCKKWYHELCAPLEEGQKGFICDHCNYLWLIIFICFVL